MSMLRSMPGQTPQLLATLLTVPHLGIVCINEHLLKELRSVCSEARQWSSGLITGLTMALDKPLNEMHTVELSTLLSGCQLRRLCVLLHLDLKMYGELLNKHNSDHTSSLPRNARRWSWRRSELTTRATTYTSVQNMF